MTLLRRLKPEEHAVEDDRHQDEEGREERRGGRVTGRFGEPRNHQSHGGERNEHPEIGRRALQVEDLFPVPEPTEDERQPEHPVEHDHEDREHRVPGEGRHLLAGDHHRGDHHDLDADHREGQDEGAEWFPQPDRQTVGVADHAERRPEHHREEPGEHEGRPRRIREVTEPATAEDREDHHRDDADEQGRLASGEDVGTPGTALRSHEMLARRSLRSILTTSGRIAARSMQMISDATTISMKSIRPGFPGGRPSRSARLET